MNDMRERINAIVQDETKTKALLAAGCVMPRFKVGQTVWCILDSKIYRTDILTIELHRWNDIFYETSRMDGVESEFYATLAEAQAAMEGEGLDVRDSL